MAATHSCSWLMAMACGIGWRQSVQRREFITLLAGAALIGPSKAIAQTPKVYRLGTLTAGPPMGPASGDAAVLIGALTQRGYTLGQNLTYEARGAAGKLSQMPQQMQELKTANVDVVVTVSYPAAVIAKSSGIPTVIATGSGDPVAAGLVASLARPGEACDEAGCDGITRAGRNDRGDAR